MKQKEFNINEVVITDLDGNVLKVEALGKEVGNLIYRNLATIDWLEKAKLIHQGLPVELSDLERLELSEQIKSGSCRLVLALKEGLLKYINTPEK